MEYRGEENKIENKIKGENRNTFAKMGMRKGFLIFFSSLSLYVFFPQRDKIQIEPGGESLIGKIPFCFILVLNTLTFTSCL